MKAMLKNVVLSYVNLFEARKMNDSGDASYSVCLLIDKDSPEVPKIKAAIGNARAYLAVIQEFGSFDRYIWQFTNHRTLRDPKGMTKERIPARSAESDLMSKDLKKRGFRFVGSTICYAHMQATGMVDDHVKGCFRYRKRS